MQLGELPPEIVERIIGHAIPESFESLALSCKDFHQICKPFIAKYNVRKIQLQNFRFMANKENNWWLSKSYQLIKWIAIEPLVARYVRVLDLSTDCIWSNRREPEPPAVMIDLFAKSTSLREAGIDWRVFHVEVEEDVAATRFSLAAALFLTILPNIEFIMLPRLLWKLPENDGQNVETRKLLDIVIRDRGLVWMDESYNSLVSARKKKPVEFSSRSDHEYRRLFRKP